jgi:hypothetical protein
MASQVVAILALILGQHGQGRAFLLDRIGQIALWVVVVTALASAVDYFRRFNLASGPRLTAYPIAGSQGDRKVG